MGSMEKGQDIDRGMRMKKKTEWRMWAVVSDQDIFNHLDGQCLIYRLKQDADFANRFGNEVRSVLVRLDEKKGGSRG